MNLGSKIALWTVAITVLAVVSYFVVKYVNRATPEQFDKAYRLAKEKGYDIYDMSDDLDDIQKGIKLLEVKELFQTNLTKKEADEFIELLSKGKDDKLSEARWIELFKKSISGFVKTDGTTHP